MYIWVLLCIHVYCFLTFLYVEKVHYFSQDPFSYGCLEKISRLWRLGWKEAYSYSYISYIKPVPPLFFLQSLQTCASSPCTLWSKSRLLLLVCAELITQISSYGVLPYLIFKKKQVMKQYVSGCISRRGQQQQFHIAQVLWPYKRKSSTKTFHCLIHMI